MQDDIDPVKRIINLIEQAATAASRANHPQDSAAAPIQITANVGPQIHIHIHTGEVPRYSTPGQPD